jgi:hypothetical protein
VNCGNFKFKKPTACGELAERAKFFEFRCKSIIYRKFSVGPWINPRLAKTAKNRNLIPQRMDALPSGSEQQQVEVGSPRLETVRTEISCLK